MTLEEFIRVKKSPLYRAIYDDNCVFTTKVLVTDDLFGPYTTDIDFCNIRLEGRFVKLGWGKYEFWTGKREYIINVEIK